jgi:hypothetical protein
MVELKTRRGRPPKKLTFNEAVDKMFKDDVNWEDVAKRQETELSYAHAHNEKLTDKIKELEVCLNKSLAIIDYLESKVENLTIRSR